MLLHPQARDLLFNHYRVLRLIFNDVLGHFELDYLSIALLHNKQQWLFLSSQPSIEQNLIEHDLWDKDPCLKLPWQKDEPMIWHELYQNGALAQFKLRQPKFAYGFSSLIQEHLQPMVLSFAVKSQDPYLHQSLMEQQQALIAMAKYCLHNIAKEIKLNLFNEHLIVKPKLTLVINNF